MPTGLVHSHLNLRPTIGKEQITPFNKLEFRTLDFKKEFGIADFDVNSIDQLRKNL